MANRYWVGGGSSAAWTATGNTNWSDTSGGANNFSVPTTADDVFFDASSPACTVSSGAAARSVDCTGYTNTWTHTAAVTLAIGDGTAGTGNIALKLAAGMTYTLGSTTTSVIQFQSTSATQQTITTAGKTMGAVTVNGTGSSYQLADTYTGRVITLTAGTLDTNGVTINLVNFVGTGSTARTLTLGSSVITLTDAGTPWSFATVTNLTFNANTSQINITGSGPSIQGGGLTYNNMTISGASTSVLIGANTFNNLSYTPAGGSYLQLNTNQVVSGTLALTGTNSSTNRILVNSSTFGTQRTVTAANVSLTNVDLRDFAAAGAATWSGTSVGNAGNNSGVTFTTPKTVYGIATGSWSVDASWSSTSGGSADTTHPICHDTVILNAASGGITSTNNLVRPCATFTCTGFTGQLAMSADAQFHGSIIFSSTMTYSGNGDLSMVSTGAALTLTTGGITLTSLMAFSTINGGSVTLLDNLTTTRNVANAVQVTTSGTLDISNRTVTLSGIASTFLLANSSTLTMTNATVNLGATNAVTIWSCNATGVTLSASGSTINITGASANTRTFAGAGKTYGTLNYTGAGSTGQLTITGANTFNTLNFSDSSNARTLIIPASTTQTFTNLNCSGGSGRLITINSSSAATGAAISIASGTTSLDYVSLRDITMTGGATFYAGNNSTNTSNNAGMFWFAPLTGSGAGFNPLSNITWAAAYWANDPAWATPGGGNAVSSLRDGSGNSRTMTQGSGTLQPTYTTYDSDVNNRATLTFDGSADYLAYASGFTLAQPLTVIAVAKSTDPADQEPIICQAGQIFSNFKGSTGDSYRMTAPTPVDYGTTDTAKHLARFFFNGASSAIQVDASISGALNPGANGFSTIATGIGANAGSGPTSLFTGEIAFVGVYNGDITANANWNAFLGWVDEFYGISGGYASSGGNFFELF